MISDWTSTLGVLAAGSAVGIVGVVLVSRSRANTLKKPLEKAPKHKPAASGGADVDLVARRDAALTRLRDFNERTAGDTSEDIATERRLLEREAAFALRDLDKKQGEASAAAVAAAADPASRPAPNYTWAWALGSAVVAVTLTLGLQSFTTTRAPGGSMTGGPAMAPPPAEGGQEEAAAAPRPISPEVAALEQKLAANPNDLSILSDLADANLNDGAFFEAFQQAKTVIAKQPDNARALTIQSVVRGMMGQVQLAFDLADRAASKDPKLVLAWVQRGRMAEMLARDADAEPSIAKARQIDPEKTAEYLARFESRPEEQGGRAPPPRPMMAPPAQAPAAVDAASHIQGTIELDPSLQGTVSPGAFIFVMAKDGAGPMPVAAKRFAAGGFPITFALGAEDAVMGRPIPDEVVIEARLDADGSATTRSPTDPIARVEHVTIGAAGLKLVLRTP